MPALFHLAFPIHDLAAAKQFYVDGLGCVLGRESSTAVTLGLAGHQVIAHLSTEPIVSQKGIYRTSVDVGGGVAGLGRSREGEGSDVLSATSPAVCGYAYRTSHLLLGRPFPESSRI